MPQTIFRGLNGHAPINGHTLFNGNGHLSHNGHFSNGHAAHNGVNGHAHHNGHATLYIQNGHTTKCNGHTGEILTGYVGAGPPKGSGLHRYVILVFKQPKKITFDEPRIPNTSGDKRPKFSIKQFAQKYSLEGPIAGNFFQAEWDEYVPILYKQLGS